jgi:P4 family phage/plasmid primase-like protien
MANLRPIAGGAPSFDRGDHVELAEQLIVDLGEIAAENTFTEGEFYRYEGDATGIYVPVEKAELSRIVQRFAGALVGTKEKRYLKLKASDVGGAIKLASDQIADPEFFGGAKPGIAFAGSFVEVTAQGIVKRAPSPTYRARAAYDFPYEPTALPKRFLQFFDEVFRDDADRAEKIALIQEHGGMSIIGRGTHHQKVVCMPGDGNNGKSVLVKICQACMPVGSVISVPPHDMDEDCKRAKFSGALFNVVSELAESEIPASEPWKAIVDGSTIGARKVYGHPFEFKPVAGHMYCCNRLPGTTDQTKGFWRRWAVVPFNRTFTDDEKDPTLAETIIANERPAIVAWFLEGARRALGQKTYTTPASSAAAIAAWRQKADQVAAFLEEQYDRLEGADLANYNAWIKADYVYKNYQTWAVANGHKTPMVKPKFGERMALLGAGSHKNGDAYLVQGYVYPVRLK